MAAEPNLDIDNNDLSPLGTPDDGDGASLEAEEDPECLPDQPNASDPPPPKRKGGRKPVGSLHVVNLSLLTDLWKDLCHRRRA